MSKTTKNVKYADLDDFMNKNKSVAGSKLETHQCVEDTYRINFIVSPENYKEFMKLYIKKLKEKKQLTVLEKSHDDGPLYYDFDIKTTKNEPAYTIEQVKAITLIITNTLKNCFRIEEPDDSTEESKDTENNEVPDIFMAYILLKDTGTFNPEKNEYSNGFHIHYPHTHVSLINKLFAFEQIKSKLKDDTNINNILENAETTLDALIDEKVITKTKWWYMYGSGKFMNKEIHDYKVKMIIDKTGAEKKITTASKLVNILSIIKHDATINLAVKTKKMALYEAFQKKFNEDKEKKKISKKLVFQNETNEGNDDESNVEAPILLTEEINNIEMAKKLLGMLNKKRSDDYTDWGCVCCALVSISEHLRSDFHEFSKLCTSKYNKNECDKKWNETLTCNVSGFGMHSLKGWAKRDNPSAYREFKNEHTMKLLDNVNNLKALYDIAEIIHFCYRDEFVCVGLKQNMWYYFNSVKWIPNNEAFTLSNKLSKEFAFECQKRSFYYGEKSINTTGTEADNFMVKKKMMDALSINLRGDYKDKVLKQSKTIFYDADFMKKLNDDNFLVGFENGVYDLNKRKFRKAAPEDYISYTVGYNYETSHSQAVLNEVENFIKSIMPNDDELLYLMCYIASILEGGNKNQIFMVWTGSGSNGKGTITQLIDIAMGDYYSTVDVSLLTQSRGNSGAASPQVADKVGKRCLFVSEPDEGAKLQSSYMKNLTGEDKIQSRALYQDPFYYYPKFKLCLQCNELPEIMAIDGGTWRRIKLLFFGQKFVEKPTKPNEKPLNPELRNKIKTWGPAFMHLLIHKYYPIYASKGLSALEPDSVKNATNSYKENSDSYYEFLTYSYVKTDDAKDFIVIDELWMAYSEWLKKAYPNSKLSNSKKLKTYLEILGHNVVRNKVFGLKHKENEDA